MIVPNAWIRELYRVLKGVDERINEGGFSVTQWVSRGRDGMIL